MKLKFIFSIVFTHLVFGLILAANIGILEPNKAELKNLPSSNETAVDLTGEISVDIQEACLNQTQRPLITLTANDSDTSGGPYTFVYTYNGSTAPPQITTGDATSISISQLTNTAGVFTYTLISITDDNGVEGTIIGNPEITITVHPLPEVSIEVVSGNGECSGTPVVFSSSVSGDGPFSYDWSFGDGATSTNPTPTHTYTENGCGNANNTVTLTVTDGNGCSSSASQVVNILKKPELLFLDLLNSPSFENCSGGNLLVRAISQSPSDSCISSYDVDWGDGSEIETDISFPIDHEYTQLGVFDLIFFASGDNGCNATKIIEVVNSTNPEGGVLSPGSTTNICAPSDPLLFVISNWHNNPSDTSYIINFGDGTSETFLQPNLVASEYFDPPQDYPIPHVYAETNCPSSEYFLDFEFLTNCGIGTIGTVGPISLVTPPEVSFVSPENGCVDTPITFTNTSINGYATDCSTEARWTWDYGDGTFEIFDGESTPPDGVHTYTLPGLYEVNLTALNNAWGSCLPEPFTRQICIEAPLIPLFSLSETEACGPLTTEVTNNTDESNTCEVTYFWDITYQEGYCGNTSIYSFINGTDETSVNPDLLFTGPGTYSLTLRATNTCGTIVSPPQNINVKAPPTITLDSIDDVCAPAEITPTYDFDLCEANTQEFNWIITGGTSPTDWEFIDGSNASSSNPTINFITPNTYTITVELTNECGNASSSQSFLLLPVPEITNIDLIQTICSGTQVDEIVFESTEPGTTFSWITNATANIDDEVASG
ncbi:MAG: PKD domain-containing protein, partial [Flavobacteriaceae bacterium]